jgi:glycosyltransferase involved in cell wall biosynthesis
MKILLVHNLYQQVGGETVVFEQERDLLERAGHQVLTHRRSNFEAESYAGLRKIALLKTICWSSDTKEQLGQLFRKEKPQVVHVHNTFMMISPSLFAACREANVPVVQTLHNYRLLCPANNFLRDGKVCEECADHTLWRGIRYGCYRGSRAATATVALMTTVQRQRDAFPDLFVAVSEFSRQKFISRGIPANKIVVKPNFVYPDPGARSRDGEYALFAGRLTEEKGVATLLTAWKQLRRDIPLKIVGDGALYEVMKARAAGLKLANVTFRGRLSREETIQAIKSSRFLIAPSECYENCPMGITEAFACGVPVIGSALGAMQRMIDDGRTGLHFTPRDATDLASKVDWAWTHPERMREMGKQARLEFESKYTAEKSYSLLMEIYQRAGAIETGLVPAEAEVGIGISQA